jgi:hydroxylamine reductase
MEVQVVQEGFFEGLRAVADTAATMDGLLPAVLKVGEINLKCMELLDKANTGTYGTPVPTTVPLTIEKGPFIVITGHDLKDLEQLLEQTKDKGVNIYTHGEMLPAHAYPKLKAYPHLKGNFGTAWQNQTKEFDRYSPRDPLHDQLPDAAQSQLQRQCVHDRSRVAYPGITHIGDNKDFTR